MTPSEYVEPPEPSKWPGVVGTINIVLATLGLLCYGCGAGNALLGPVLARMMAQGQQVPTPPPVVTVTQVVVSCASFLLSCWLLAAGIGLVKRLPWARNHAIGWSVAKIALSLISTGAGVALAEENARMINNQMTQGGQAPPFTFTAGLFIAIAAVSLAWYLIWPVVLLLWLSRGSVREEVRLWGGASAGTI
jgi:hypothetical protein